MLDFDIAREARNSKGLSGVEKQGWVDWLQVDMQTISQDWIFILIPSWDRVIKLIVLRC